MLKEIFQQQYELMVKLEAVEAANGLLLHDSIPVDLESKKGQAALRVIAWRITEEIAEAITAHDRRDHQAFHSEISDIFHFLVELLILAGIDWKMAESYFKHPAPLSSWIEMIQALGMTMNRLKNKPWSLKHQPLRNVYDFHHGLLNVISEFTAICSHNKIDLTTLYALYYSKHQVVLERAAEKT